MDQSGDKTTVFESADILFTYLCNSILGCTTQNDDFYVQFVMLDLPYPVNSYYLDRKGVNRPSKIITIFFNERQLN